METINITNITFQNNYEEIEEFNIVESCQDVINDYDFLIVRYLITIILIWFLDWIVNSKFYNEKILIKNHKFYGWIQERISFLNNNVGFTISIILLVYQLQLLGVI